MFVDEEDEQVDVQFEKFCLQLQLVMVLLLQ
jgi:hypothetical protein